MKKNEFKGLTKEQMQAKLEELTAMYGKLKFAHGVTNLENPLQIRALRRDIARLNTHLTSGN